MADGIRIGGVYYDVSLTPDEQSFAKMQARIREMGQSNALTIKLRAEGGEQATRTIQQTEQATTDAQQRIDALFKQSGDKARSSAESIKQALREQAEATKQSAREQVAAQQQQIAAARLLGTEVNDLRRQWRAGAIDAGQLEAGMKPLITRAEQQKAAFRALGLEVEHNRKVFEAYGVAADRAVNTVNTSQGISTPGGFSAGINQGIQSALGQFGVAGDLLGGFVQLIAAKRAAAINTAQGLGGDTMQGLVQGMKSNQAEVKRVATDTAETIEKSVRDELDIRSPSRVMEYLGRMAGAGFVSGIRSMTDEARAAAKGLSSAATAGVAGNVAGGAFGAVSGGAMGGVIEAQKVGATSDAVGKLNGQLAENAKASQMAANAGAATEVATESLGAAVEGAAERVQQFSDAYRDGDDASRQAALNEAKTALAFTATAAAAVGAAVAITASYNTAADYEAAMKKAGATTEATAAQMGQLGELARSKPLQDLAVGGITAAAGIEELGSQGLSTAQILDGGLITSLTLAKAVTTDVATAGAIAASSVKAFGLEAKDLARVGDIVTNAVNGTSIKIDSFKDAIAAGGSQAKASSVDFATFTATLSFLTDKAMSAADAGTSIKSFLMALTPNSKDAAAEMKRLGFSAFTAEGNFKSLGGIADNLRSSFSKLTPEQRAASAEMIFGSDGARVFNALIEQGASGLERRIGLLDRMGKMDQSAKEKLEGARGEQEKFNAALENFKIAAGEAFLPTGAAMLRWATDFATQLAAITTEMGKMKEGAAAFGAQDFSLRGWLQRSGLRESDLTPAELAQVKKLLANAQRLANVGGQNSTVFSNLGLDGMANLSDRKTAEAVGRLTAQLQTIQNTATNRPRDLGPNMGGSAGAMPVEIVGGKNLVSLLGMGGRTVLNPFGVSGKDYHHDGAVRADATHNGVDYAAKRGAPILAPFSGTLSVRENATSGKIFELVDSAGNKLVGIHLDHFDKEVLKALEKGGGKALIGQGTRIGGVGNTGTTAGKTPHLHLMGYAAGNTTPIDPTKITFLGAENRSPLGSKVDSGASNNGDDKNSKDGPITAAQIARAQQLLATLDKAQEALKKNPSSVGLVKAFDAADQAVKAWTKDNDANARALNAVRQSQDGLNKSSGEYIATQGDIRKHGNDALRLLKDQEKAYKSGSAEQRTAADQAIANWRGEDKARGAVLEAERAAYQVRQQARQKAAQEEERAAREAENAEKEAERKTQEANTRRARIAEAARQGRIVDARQELTRLEADREQEIKAAGNNLQKRLEVEKRYANLIRDAKRDIARREFEDAKRDAENRGDANTANDIKRAERARNQASRNAGNEAKNRVTEAEEAVTEQTTQKVRGLRNEYQQLAESIRDKIKAGTFDAEAQQEATKAFNALSRASKEAGLYSNDYVEGARKSTWASIRAGDAARVYAEGLQTLDDKLEASSVAQMGAAKEAGDFADELMELGRPGDALLALEAALDAVMDAAGRGEVVGEAVSFLTDKINRLTLATKEARAAERQANAAELALADPLKPTPARNSGSIRDKFATPMDETPVEARGTRPAPKKNPDGTLYEDPGVAARDPNAASRAEGWEQAMRVERVEEYRKGLEKLDLAQLEAAKSQAILAKDAERYGMIVAEISRKKDASPEGVFKATEKGVQDLIKSFQAGEISLEDFGQQAGPLTVKMERMGLAAEKAGNPKLAALYRDLAASLRNGIPVIEETTSALEKMNKWGDYADQIAGGFQAIGGALDGNLGANVAGFGKALSTTVSIVKDIATGNYIGAAIKFFTTLIEAIGGFQKANRQAIEQQKQFNEQFSFINGDDYSKTFVKSRGFFADLFGGGPEVKQEVDKMGLMFAKSLESGFANGIKNGLKQAIVKNDFSSFSQLLRESVYDGILEGVVDAFINGEILKNIIGPAIKAWSDALKTPSTADDAAALAGIDAAIQETDRLAQRFYSDVAPKLSGIGQNWGIGQDGGMSNPGTSSAGVTTGVSFAIPKIEVTLPDALTRPLGEFAAVIPEFRLGTSELRLAVSEWRDFMRNTRGGVVELSPAFL